MNKLVLFFQNGSNLDFCFLINFNSFLTSEKFYGGKKRKVVSYLVLYMLNKCVK